MAKKFSINFLMKGVKEALIKQDSLNNSLKKTKIQAEGIKGQFSQIGSKTGILSGTFNTLSAGFEKARDKISGFGNLKGSLGKLSSGFGDIGGSIKKKVLEGLVSLAGMIPGVGGMLSGLIAPLAAMGTTGTASFLGISMAAAPITAIILAIIGFVLLLKRAWDLNIGGMQTTAFKIFGKIQNTFFQLRDAFDKVLKDLAPFFKVVFGVIGAIVVGVFKTIVGIVKVAMAIFSPIAKAIGNAFKPLTGLFDKTKEGTGIFKTLGKVMVGIGKVIGTVFSIPIRIIGFIIKGVILLINVVKQVASAFSKLEFVQKIFGGIVGAVKLVKAGIDALLAPFKFIFETIGKVISFFSGGKKEMVKEPNKKTLQTPVSPAVQTASQIQKQTTSTINNNPNITVNTSREISQRGAEGFSNSLAGILANES